MSYLLLNTPVTVGPATTIQVNGGNGQTATVGTAVAVNPSVVVTDAGGNPVSGVAITFAVASGGGSITGSSQTTGANGLATVGSWTLGVLAGTNTLTATSGTLTGSPVTFSAAGTAGAAATISAASPTTGSGTPGGLVQTLPTVLVTDAHGNPVSGTTITFAVTVGGGSGTGLTPTTSGIGQAVVGSWTLGVIAGVNRMTATAGGLTGSPVTFTVVATGAPNVARMRHFRWARHH